MKPPTQVSTNDEFFLTNNDTQKHSFTLNVLIICKGEEFCAALKIPFPQMKVYERKKKHKKDIVDGQKYRFKYTDTIRNKV